MDYRREIDGLRAFAVLPVIFFHSGLDLIPGGFLGVDIFFVISGYLITIVILSDIHLKKFSILSFYERRTRRIFPALFFVLFICTLLSLLILLPSDAKAFFQSLIAVLTFSSNIYFWKKTNYFDLSSELNPLLHTWSLAVEEQFYLIAPLLIILLYRSGKKWMLFFWVFSFFCSLFLAQLTVHQMPVATFYLLPTRCWELILGMLAGIYLFNNNSNIFDKSVREIGSLCGIGLIIYSFFSFSIKTPSPSFYTLLPVVGSVLIIIFSNCDTFTGRILSSKIFVGIGLISYSAYLWHQPLFAFAKYYSMRELSVIYILFIIFNTFILAFLTWNFIELPFRRNKKFSQKFFFSIGTIIFGFFLLIGFLGINNEGFRYRLPPNIVWQSLGEKLSAKGDVCQMQPLVSNPGIVSCEFGDISSSKSIYIYGDSHAQAISDELNKKLIDFKIKGVKIAIENCDVIPSIVETKNPISKSSKCLENFNFLLEIFKASNSDVIVISRWTFRLYPISNWITEMPYRNESGVIEKENYREYAVNYGGKLDFSETAKNKAVNNFINGLISTNRKIIFVYPIPEMAWNIAYINWSEWNSKETLPTEISISYDEYISRNRFVTKLFNNFSGEPNFIPIKPENIFCNTFIINRCVAQYNGIPFYYDDDHLSDEGARFLVDDIISKIQLN